MVQGGRRERAPAPADSSLTPAGRPLLPIRGQGAPEAQPRQRQVVQAGQRLQRWSQGHQQGGQVEGAGTWLRRVAAAVGAAPEGVETDAPAAHSEAHASMSCASSSGCWEGIRGGRASWGNRPRRAARLGLQRSDAASLWVTLGEGPAAGRVRLPLLRPALQGDVVASHLSMPPRQHCLQAQQGRRCKQCSKWAR